jgi:hypothetical protein
MKGGLAILILLIPLLSACGSSSSQPSAFCQSVSTVKDDVNNLKALKKNPSLADLKAELQKLYTDVNKAIQEAKGAATPHVNAVKSSVKTLKSTFSQVSGGSMNLIDAVPTIKTQAQTVSSDWQALTQSMKC